jgi:hypothetical protein
MSEHLAVTSASSAGASRLTLRASQKTHSCKNVSKVFSYCIRQQAAGGSFHRRLKLMLTHSLLKRSGPPRERHVHRRLGVCGRDWGGSAERRLEKVWDLFQVSGWDLIPKA